jgi:hypothetical protein
MENLIFLEEERKIYVFVFSYIPSCVGPFHDLVPNQLTSGTGPDQSLNDDHIRVVGLNPVTANPG